MKPGIYQIDRQEYEQIEAVNYSTLKHFSRSALHAREEMLHPSPPTPAMIFGNILHIAVLEPKRFNQEFVLAPRIDRRTKEGKAEWIEFEAKNEGKTVLSADQWEQCQGIIKSIRSNDRFCDLLYSAGKNELSFVWKDAETGLLCKGRLDRLTRFQGWSAIVDVKTTVSAEVGLFTRQSARMLYHVQAAFYLDGLQAIQPTERERDYYILAIEKTRPYGMRLFEFNEDAIYDGREKYRYYLRQYKECYESGIWPGYNDMPEPLAIPSWAMGNYEIDFEKEV